MPSIYDITYENRIVDLLPPDKRYIRMVQFLRAMVKELQFLHTFLFGEYRTGSVYPAWNSLVSYSVDDKVIYGESVYISLVDSNNATPGTSTNWKVYHQFFIGVEERLKYNTQKLVLEYALNVRFGTVFRQPPLVSDIYIDNNIPEVGVFVVGYSEDISSVTYFDRSYEFMINSYTLGSFYNYSVNVPADIYFSAGTTDEIRQKVFRQFIDRYNPVGLNYNIIPY